jgi:hypothetical protein
LSAANLPTQPSPLHLHRPLHLMRQPSINPPAFYDDVAPPPLLTPPPNYDDLTPRIEVRHGYFDTDASEDNSDENTVTDDSSSIATSEAESIQLPSDLESEPESGPSTALMAEAKEETDDEADIEEEDIVDMVGLEDLSMNIRATSPVGSRRSSDFLHVRGGIWVS